MSNSLSSETLNDLRKYGGEALVSIVKALLGDTSAIVDVMKDIKNAPFFIPNSVFMLKYERLLNGIYTDSSDKIKISNQLFGEDYKSRIDNAFRVINIINKIDTVTKIDYLLNANRAFCNGVITREQLFRIANALANSLSEDIEYLRSNATCEVLKGNANVHSLVNIGAVILAGINSDADVEKQTYVITDFGRLLDQYALSVMDDERQKYYRERTKKHHAFDTGIEAITSE